MKIKKWIKGIGVIAVLGCTLFSAYAESVFVSANSANVVDYKETDVLDDLKVLPSFSAENYPKKTIDELGYPKAETIFCSEYCYADYSIYDEYYGLYLYVYNPTQTPIYKNGHWVNMVIGYDAESKPIYHNIPLEMLDISDDAIMNNRFIKFRVSNKVKEFKIYDEDGEEKKVNLLEFTRYYAKKNENKRRYDIAGVQIAFGDGWCALDSTCGRTYYFEGFSKGLSSESLNESTLVCTSDYLDTISLEVQHTYHRFEPVNNVSDTLSTAYFSIPQKVYDEYKTENAEYIKLQKIKAEWYEYKTKEIFVTSNQDAYNALDEWINKPLANGDEIYYSWNGNTYLANNELRYRVMWGERDETWTSIGDEVFTYDGAFNALVDGNVVGFLEGDENGNFKFSDLFNSEKDAGSFIWAIADTHLPQFEWLIKIENTEDKVSVDKLKEYMKTYTSKYANGQYVESKYYKNGDNLDEIDTTKLYAAGLFIDELDADRANIGLTNDKNIHHKVVEHSADEKISYTYTTAKDFWDNFFNREGTVLKDSISPIVEVREDLSRYNAESFSDDYHIRIEDAQKVLDYCKREQANGNIPILYRFALTDYYCGVARFDNEDADMVADQNGYVAQETMFLDFDIISLTLRDDNNVETVLAVVSNPTDIINGLDPAPSLGEYSRWSIGTFLTNVFIFVGVSGGAFVVFLIGKKIIDHYRE